MRVAILGKWHKYCSYFLHGCLEGCIQNGYSAMAVEFISVDLAVTKSALKHYRPDVVLCHMLFSEEGSGIEDKLQAMREIKKEQHFKLYYQLGDPRVVPRYGESVKGIVDGALLAHREWDGFKCWGVPLYYFPYGCLKADFPKERELKYDLTFAGTYPSGNALYQDRTLFINKLREKEGIATFPERNQYNTTFITDILASSSVGMLNVLGRHDLKDFLSLRPFQFIGAGAFSIQKRLNGIDDVFIDRVHHVVFDNYDIDEVLGIVKYYKKHQDERRKIIHKGFNYCQQHHSYKNRIKDLFEMLDGKRKEVRYKLEDF